MLVLPAPFTPHDGVARDVDLGGLDAAQVLTVRRIRIRISRPSSAGGAGGMSGCGSGFLRWRGSGAGSGSTVGSGSETTATVPALVLDGCLWIEFIDDIFGILVFIRSVGKEPTSLIFQRFNLAQCCLSSSIA